jgi:hypothetical protein
VDRKTVTWKTDVIQYDNGQLGLNVESNKNNYIIINVIIYHVLLTETPHIIGMEYVYSFWFDCDNS